MTGGSVALEFQMKMGRRFMVFASSTVLWTLAQPAVAQDRTLVQTLHWLGQTFGGLALAVSGELSWINLLTPKALFLVPLTRFPDSSGSSRQDSPCRIPSIGPTRQPTHTPRAIGFE
jgi:hypothetical protein